MSLRSSVNKNMNINKLKIITAVLVFLVAYAGLSFENTIVVNGSSASADDIGGKTSSALEEKRSPQVLAAVVTAYNSLPEQTDDTPFITASGERTGWGVVANNCLEFGTKVRIAGEIFEVQDRMNSRYGCEYFDIWMEHYDQAVQFGKRILEVELIN